MMYNQELMLRRKSEEQAELQQAIEYRGGGYESSTPRNDKPKYQSTANAKDMKIIIEMVVHAIFTLKICSTRRDIRLLCLQF